MDCLSLIQLKDPAQQSLAKTEQELRFWSQTALAVLVLIPTNSTIGLLSRIVMATALPIIQVFMVSCYLHHYSRCWPIGNKCRRDKGLPPGNSSNGREMRQ